MVSSDSDDDAYEDLDFDGVSDDDNNIDEEILGALEEDLAAAAAAEATEGDEVRRYYFASRHRTSYTYHVGYRLYHLGWWFG